jgi:uncharacterized membrane protein
LTIAIIAGLIALLIFFPQGLQMIVQMIKKKKEKKAQDKQEANREALDVLVKKTIGS